MVNFTTEQIQNAMSQPNNIRNISIIAHVDCGKTTTTDSLLKKAGFISDKQTGSKCFTDTGDAEKERGITIKSTGISLYYELENNNYLINLIDSPGHVDFSSEVTAALRVTDGAVVLIDAVKGCCVQTETVIGQALEEMIQPVCFINKLDRLILELQLGPEEIYQRLNDHLLSLNTIISRYNNKLDKIELNPIDGTVAIGCGKMGWGFTLQTFARKWAKKLNIDEKELVSKLWGENYYSPKKGKWYDTKVKGSIRGFNLCVMKPIIDALTILGSKDNDEIIKFLNKWNIEFTKEDLEDDKNIVKCSMQKFLPNADALLEMIICHLPSPVKAQRYRVDHLYTGEKDDPYYTAIKNCDPNGPLIMYVSKLFPTPDLSRFYAFGRVFSGTIRSQDVMIQGPDYIVNDNTDKNNNNKKDIFKRRVQQVVVWMANKATPLEFCPVGNTCALAGVDNYIIKTATITDQIGASNIKDMKFSVAPIVSVAVTCKNPQKLPLLLKGLTLLTKSDPLCRIKSDKDTGEIIISGAGELHIEICIDDLQNYYAKGVEILVSDPLIPYRETVISESSEICLAKSPNKHNRIYMTSSPLDNNLLEKMQNKEITINMDSKKLSKMLTNEYGWNPDESKKIWSFSQHENTNLMVDCTKGIQYLNEIKDSVNTSFQDISIKGPLCEEPIFGIRFNIKDVNLHADAIHRGAGQIMPATRCVIYSSMLTASPRLMEPIYKVDIQCPSDIEGQIYGIMAQRRGEIIDIKHDFKTESCQLTSYLPVAESIGFTGFLRSNTGGKAFPQCTFSHWALIDSDPLEEGSKANTLVKEIRKRKGLNEELPPLSRYLDKL